MSGFKTSPTLSGCLGSDSCGCSANDLQALIGSHNFPRLHFRSLWCIQGRPERVSALQVFVYKVQRSHRTEEMQGYSGQPSQALESFCLYHCCLTKISVYEVRLPESLSSITFPKRQGSPVNKILISYDLENYKTICNVFHDSG